jgi:hypothetical protein
MIIRAKFLNVAQGIQVSNFAFEVSKRPLQYRKYDYQFDSGDGAFYCAEIFVAALESVLGKENNPFVNRQILGVVTSLPDDFRAATDKMEMIAQCGLQLGPAST